MFDLSSCQVHIVDLRIRIVVLSAHHLPTTHMKTITDAARVQEIRNSIEEGTLILRTGMFHGRKLSTDQLHAVRTSVTNAERKIGECLLPANTYTIEDVTPAGYGPSF